jgi:hypothetical protein
MDDLGSFVSPSTTCQSFTTAALALVRSWSAGDTVVWLGVGVGVGVSVGVAETVVAGVGVAVQAVTVVATAKASSRRPLRVLRIMDPPSPSRSVGRSA